ncbi:hypothetical protein [Saliphagus infecundisoli]|uniref:CARDB domain-containing protein n=1 Tax=Saliphagus infecundisoli TaxID=1849069 RepID=A0ABD5QCV7_9EURY|nr:hypothetical protein [Saliphagus infecundisoli]
MDRRQYLVGVSAVGAALPAGINTSATTRVSPSISVIETNEPVEGGGLLEVTTMIESGSASRTRPEIEIYVGDELQVTRRHSLDPGGSDTFDFQHRTYPVQRDVEFPIRFEIEGKSTAHRVEVQGIVKLESSAARPGRELTIHPETQVMFEVDDVFPDGQASTHWYRDGKNTGFSMGPWSATYHAHVGADYWWESFESEGSYEVATALVSEEQPNRTARWNITVDEDGAAPPTVEAARPDTGKLVLDGTQYLELDVAAPDGDLDRVIWWLHQVDDLLGISSVSGTSDTAAIEVDGHCLGCDIYAWVLTESNIGIEANPWVLMPPEQDDSSADDETGGKEASHTVSIRETSDPVEGGEFLSVTTTIENTGGETATIEAELVVSGEIVDSSTVTVGPGERKPVTLGYKTYPVAQDVEFPVRVETADDADERIVSVDGTDS